MPPPNLAIDSTSHRTVRYFPHPTPYRYFKNLIFLLCFITKIIDPNYDFTHYPNKLLDIYTSNRTLDLSPIPFGTTGASILFPPIPLPGFPTPTCQGQQCRYEPAAADRNLTGRSRQELWGRGRVGVVRLTRGLGKWHEGSVLASVFSSQRNRPLSLDDAEPFNSSSFATISALTSTCELARGAYWAYRADHPISPDTPWIHWLSGRLNNGLHRIPCPYLDYAFIGIVLRDVLALLASAGFVVTVGLVSLLVVSCRPYLPTYSTLSQVFTRVARQIPFPYLISQLYTFLLTISQFILLSAVYVLLSAHTFLAMIFEIPPVLFNVPLYWFGHYYRQYYPSTSLPVLLCGTLFWLGFLITWRIWAPIFGLLFSEAPALIKYTYFFRLVTRRLQYYQRAYAGASRMVGPYLSYLDWQALVDFAMLLIYFMVSTWIGDEFWDAVVPNWVKYSPIVGILVWYLGISYALSGRHPSSRWVFRGLGRSEVVGVEVIPLRGELYEGWWS